MEGTVVTSNDLSEQKIDIAGAEVILYAASSLTILDEIKNNSLSHVLITPTYIQKNRYS